MCEFVDLHSHVLPGIDDGSPNIETSMKMIQAACESGVTTLVCTSHIMPPHYDNSAKNLRNLTNLVASEAEKRGLDIELRPGGEIYFTDNMIDRFKDKAYPEYSPGMLLIEFPMNEIPRYAEDTFFQLELAGVEVVLAHPARNQGIISDIKRARKISEKGVLFLANAGSITGSYGTKVKECVFKLLDQGLVTAIASDAHRPRTFSKLIQAREIIDEKYGIQASKLLFYTNPKSIIQGKPVKNFRPDNKKKIKKIKSGKPESKKRGILKSMIRFFKKA